MKFKDTIWMQLFCAHGITNRRLNTFIWLFTTDYGLWNFGANDDDELRNFYCNTHLLQSANKSPKKRNRNKNKIEFEIIVLLLMNNGSGEKKSKLLFLRGKKNYNNNSLKTRLRNSTSLFTRHSSFFHISTAHIRILYVCIIKTTDNALKKQASFSTNQN